MFTLLLVQIYHFISLLYFVLVAHIIIIVCCIVYFITSFVILSFNTSDLPHTIHALWGITSIQSFRFIKFSNNATWKKCLCEISCCSTLIIPMFLLNYTVSVIIHNSIKNAVSRTHLSNHTRFPSCKTLNPSVKRNKIYPWTSFTYYQFQNSDRFNILNCCTLGALFNQIIQRDGLTHSKRKETIALNISALPFLQ